ADQRRRNEYRPERAPPRRSEPAEPPRENDGQQQADGDRRPEPDVVDPPGEAGIGMDEKRVVEAVAPAVEIEQRVAEKRPADDHQGGDAVPGRARPALESRPDATGGEGDAEVEDERQPQRPGQRSEAANDPRPAVPALPVGPEPGDPRQDREGSDSPRPRV